MESPNPRRAVPIVIFVATAVFVTGLDLWTKVAVFEFLQVESAGAPPRVVRQTEFPVIPGFFDLQANYNYGAFSGWFSEHTWGLTVLSAAALVVLAGFFTLQFRGGAKPSAPFTMALALLWGGTLGNLYDRLTLGAVRDWIKWFYVSGGKEHVWPNFNVADSAICVGVSLWILLEALHAFRARRARKASEPGSSAG